MFDDRVTMLFKLLNVMDYMPDETPLQSEKALLETVIFFKKIELKSTVIV